MNKSWVFLEGSKKFFPVPLSNSSLVILKAVSVGANRRNTSSLIMQSFTVKDRIVLRRIKAQTTKVTKRSPRTTYVSFCLRGKTVEQTSSYLKKQLTSFIFTFSGYKCII